MKIYLLFLWVTYPLIEALTQFELRVNYEWKPNYLQLFCIRGIVAIVHGALMDVEIDALHYYSRFEYLQPLLLLTFQVTSFWIIFDPVYNHLTDQNIFYRGKESGWMDRLPIKIWYVLKVIALIAFPLSLVQYIKTYL